MGEIIIDVPDVDLVDFVIRRDLEPSNAHGVTYYKSFDGLNIVVETPESAQKVNMAYNSSGNGWFYMLHEANDLKDAYFRLPRMKGMPITSGESEDVFGNSYIENLAVESDESSSLSLVKHKMYFYMGVPTLKREEVAVNSVFAAINQFDTKLNKSVFATQSVEFETGGDGKKFAVAKLNQNAHEFIWKMVPSADPEEELPTTLRIDLTDLLGETDYDPVTKSYPAYVYNEFTKFEFKLTVDKSQVGADTEFDIKYFIKVLGSENDGILVDVPVYCDTTETVSNYIVYSNIVDGFNPDTTPYSRSMFVFNTVNLNNGSNVVHKTGEEHISGEKTFSSSCNFRDPKLSKQNTEYKGGQLSFERADEDTTMGDNIDPYIDFHAGTFRFIGQSSEQQVGGDINTPLQIDIQNNCAYGTTVDVSDNSTKLATTEFIGKKFVVVSEMPVDPDPNVFYFIPE